MAEYSIRFPASKHVAAQHFGCSSITKIGWSKLFGRLAHPANLVFPDRQFDLQQNRVDFSESFVEFDVMHLLPRGVPITEIAERLFLSPKTVSTYRARVLEKLGLSHNADITRYVVENKLDQ